MVRANTTTASKAGGPAQKKNSIAGRQGSFHFLGRRRAMDEQSAAYWKRNVKLVTTLLIIWFVVSYGFGILFVDVMNNIKIAGFELGFWFAQQGSIYVFVALIFVYVSKMNKLDREFDVREDD
jgi:putative solute:sodium symporter small subunit|tara:strand:- start:784 stop:1152 length:369 start_codon:yes stop_codon:yes gene_type:complete